MAALKANQDSCIQTLIITWVYKLFAFVTPDFERERKRMRERETIYLTTQYAQLHIKRA